MPSIEALALLLLAALPLMGSPGPATMTVAATGAAFGLRRAVPYLIGIILGTMTALVLVASGVTGVILAVPGITPVIVAAAAGYMLYLAYRIATAPPLGAAPGDGRQPSLAGGLLLALANPKAYAAFGALFPSVVLVADHPGRDGLAKVVVLTGVIVVVNVLWLILGATLAASFRDPRSSRIINVAFALLLVASIALPLVP